MGDTDWMGESTSATSNTLPSTRLTRCRPFCLLDVFATSHLPTTRAPLPRLLLQPLHFYSYCLRFLIIVTNCGFLLRPRINLQLLVLFQFECSLVPFVCLSHWAFVNVGTYRTFSLSANWPGVLLCMSAPLICPPSPSAQIALLRLRLQFVTNSH